MRAAYARAENVPIERDTGSMREGSDETFARIRSSASASLSIADNTAVCGQTPSIAYCMSAKQTNRDLRRQSTFNHFHTSFGDLCPSGHGSRLCRVRLPQDKVMVGQFGERL